MPIVLEGREPLAGFRAESGGTDIEAFHDPRQSDFCFLLDPDMVACNGKKSSGKTVQGFGSLAALPCKEMSQQGLERFGSHKVGQRANRFGGMTGKNKC